MKVENVTFFLTSKYLPVSQTNSLFLAATVTICSLISNSSPVISADLVGRAVLPADTFIPDLTSGQFITPTNERTPPFINQQPVQGFSAVLSNGDGSYLVMSDNGFGAKTNSSDALLRFYNVTPDFKTATGGSGNVTINSFFTLRDPDNKINFPIVASQTNYPNGENNIPVDPAIGSDRLLTGADFDIESFRQVSDGTLWFGDEFGPFLLHTDATGKVLDSPIPLPNVQSPQNPFLGGGTANLPSSRGFEGMALNASATKLYPLLEGALTADPDGRRLIINEFDIASKSYTDKQFFYQMEATAGSGQAIGDFTTVDDNKYLVIERDSAQGAEAAFKKIFLVDFTQVDSNGNLIKRELVDLLNIADPNNIASSNEPFRFPFVTIESVLPIDDQTLLIVNDNNYPFSAGRTPGVPDNNEFIQVRLERPLGLTPVPEPSSSLGALTFGILGIGFALKRKLEKLKPF